MKNLEIYLLIFLSYSMFGWLMEVLLKLKSEKKFINRGFLIGPYCPIYGVGGVLMIMFLTKYKDSPIVLFVMAMFIAALLEYFTSYLLEKIFKARWWDYQSHKFNINGRICLETLVPFGLMGLLAIYIFNPILFKIYSLIPEKILTAMSAFILIVMICDIVISINVIMSIKIEGAKLRKDNTEELTEKIREVLRSKSWLHKRLIDSFPNFREMGIKIKHALKEQKRELKRKIRKAKKEYANNKAQLSQNLEQMNLELNLLRKELRDLKKNKSKY